MTKKENCGGLLVEGEEALEGGVKQGKIQNSKTQKYKILKHKKYKILQTQKIQKYVGGGVKQGFWEGISRAWVSP